MSTKDVLYLALFGLIVYLILKVRGQAMSQQMQLLDLAKQSTQPTPATTPTQTKPTNTDPVIPVDMPMLNNLSALLSTLNK